MGIQLRVIRNFRKASEDIELFCGICGKYVGNDVRWVISELVQKIEWGNIDWSIVGVEHGTLLGYFCCRKHARMAIKTYLAHYGSKLTRSNKQPLERCGICNEKFKAYESHKSIVMTTESGSEMRPDTLEENYLARFCPSCVQVESLSEFNDANDSGSCQILTKNKMVFSHTV